MKIQMIPTAQIYPHPQNPRTDNGDLSELVASIMVMGVLQNLTVVPYDPAVHVGVNIQGDGSDCYIAVAGNRRLAAAKQAKLTEVPAVVANMDIKEQTRIMLVENLQRETLTVYQQAKTIQLMLDMGDTVEEIAKQTGFSESTVRNRVKLAVFDPDKMAEVEDRGATMKDYLDLAKLEDEALRNEVLASIGTANFRNDLARAKTTLKDRKSREAQMAVFQSFATSIDSNATDGLKFVKSYYPSDKAENIRVPDDKDTVQYFYVPFTYCISLYRQVTAADDAEKLKKDAVISDMTNRKAAIQEAIERAEELRMNFAYSLTLSKVKQNFGVVVEAMNSHLMQFTRNSYTMVRMNHALLKELTGIPLNAKGEVSETDLLDASVKDPEWTMFAVAYAMMEYNTQAYSHEQWVGGVGFYAHQHMKNETLDRIYKLLIALGYQMSDEEKQLQDGTHPMFYVPPQDAKKSA